MRVRSSYKIFAFPLTYLSRPFRVPGSYMTPAEGFVLVYSITDRGSFEEISLFYERILREKQKEPGSVPVVIVGNKCDLESERQVATSGRFLFPN